MAAKEWDFGVEARACHQTAYIASETHEGRIRWRDTTGTKKHDVGIANLVLNGGVLGLTLVDWQQTWKFREASHAYKGSGVVLLRLDTSFFRGSR